MQKEITFSLLFLLILGAFLISLASIYEKAEAKAKQRQTEQSEVWCDNPVWQDEKEMAVVSAICKTPEGRKVKVIIID